MKGNWRSYINFNLNNLTCSGGAKKKVFLKISQNSPKNAYVGVSFLIKWQVSGSNFIKK